ncbi:(S)-ureidoglycine aminohydrolase [Sulfitobacter albidus]|uniref:(S)-ureidoglycine aminohydrolase n=1 Tax=Sulfitobacter albidus TaxID=2829501 RepID=A0A975JE03_9RHOB|nr:bifunctional allantoicase/(S)-ureidoglycine aminohydrolase [Sulfitobacter albidus]QUJ76525.1 (S)-ureidoglycine aminohydrolase [Sulfitobacter albidus]
MKYAFPPGGLPDQSGDPASAAVFTEAYAVLPASTQRDIVTSFLPGWQGMRMWVLARPLSGFAETFSQYAVELQPGGGSLTPEPDRDAQGVIFVTHGALRLTLGAERILMNPGSYAYLPAGAIWTLFNEFDDVAGFHWIRKRWRPAEGLTPPQAFVTHDDDVAPVGMPNTNGVWATQRFADPLDLNHDMHVNIVTFQPGGRIPFAETHVMEHGLYVLQGTARYLLNRDWIDVGPGDFMWLRAFCPQACVATGTEPFRYLLYKDVNRHMPL